MLRSLKKMSPSPSIIHLMLLIAASAYGNDEELTCMILRPKPTCITPRQEPTCIPCCMHMDPGYNYPARIETQCPRNVYTELSFNYWQPSQENMELGQMDRGTIENISISGLTTTSVTTSQSFQAINMNFDFKPGFTLCIGYEFAHDDWDLCAAYTWFHNTNTHSATATNFVLFNSNAENISPTWGTTVESGATVDYQSASEKWKLGMDLIDLDLGRWFYVGRKFTLRPSFGARAALIHQDVRISYINGFSPFSVDVPGLLGNGFFVGNAKVYNSSHSWAVGPKAALETNWLIGSGCRLFANGEADILYTRYSKLKEKTAAAGTVVGTINLVSFSFPLRENITSAQNDADYLRTHLSLNLGFAWGTHFKQCKYYIDCAAGYEFQVFFDQNMFRHDVTDSGSFIPNGNLYINGLITTVRLDF